jgi:hypothetical protein
MVAQIESLRNMTVTQLREKYRQVYGEDSRSGNKDWLWKRIAWRIQELKHGGLSERAKRRAAELANEADLRLRVPQNAFTGLVNGNPEKTKRVVRRITTSDNRLPMPGTVLRRKYKGKMYSVTVLEDGFSYDGRLYRSLSALAGEITGSHWNGFTFFNI